MANQGIQPMSAMDIARQLQEEWLGGEGRVTQLPGAAAPSVRKYYSYHQGYDYGTPVGTPVYAPSDVEVKGSYYDPQWGLRQVVYDPAKNLTTYLSHLSRIPVSSGTVPAGTILGYTGGQPGAYGAGNTTGPHLDITQKMGSYGTGLSQIPVYQQPQPSPKPQSSTGAKRVYEILAKKYGPSVMAVAKDPQKLKEKYGDSVKIVKVRV